LFGSLHQHKITRRREVAAAPRGGLVQEGVQTQQQACLQIVPHDDCPPDEPAGCA